MLALSGKEVRPGDDLRVLLEQGSPLALGHAAPDAELDAVVEGVGTALGDHRAVPADDGGFSLSCPADEQLIRIRLATPCLGNPRNTGFGLGAVENGLGGRIDGGPASGEVST